MFSCTFGGIFKNTFFYRTLLGNYFWLFKCIKVDKNEFRYFFKDIKVISVLAIFVTYVNFENGFACWENLKTTIQKKLQNSQKYAKKISVAEFRYNQAIFLQFTVALFHSNLDEKIMRNKQKVTSKEPKVTSNEQRAKNNEQRATSKK